MRVGHPIAFPSSLQVPSAFTGDFEREGVRVVQIIMRLSLVISTTTNPARNYVQRDIVPARCARGRTGTPHVAGPSPASHAAGPRLSNEFQNASGGGGVGRGEGCTHANCGRFVATAEALEEQWWQQWLRNRQLAALPRLAPACPLLSLPPILC